MTTDIEQYESTNESLFERLKRTDDQGHDFWSARDLMPAMGYARWERFDDTIRRARTAVDVVQGVSAGQTMFRETAKQVERGFGGHQRAKDWHLTREAAYMTAMQGDASKPEIAGALHYFTDRTIQAERAEAHGTIAPVQEPTPDVASRLFDYMRERDELDRAHRERQAELDRAHRERESDKQRDFLAKVVSSLTGSVRPIESAGPVGAPVTKLSSVEARERLSEYLYSKAGAAGRSAAEYWRHLVRTGHVVATGKKNTKYTIDARCLWFRVEGIEAVDPNGTIWVTNNIGRKEVDRVLSTPADELL